MDETKGGVVVSVEPTGPRAHSEERPAVLGSENRQLVAQFITGLLLLGGDELLKYVQAAQREIEANARWPDYVVHGKETKQDLVAYLAIGALAQGQKRLAQGVRWGVRYSTRAASLALGTMGLLIDNPLGRPLQKPIERRLNDLVREGERVVRESQRGAQSARLLASRTVGVIARDVVTEVAESPEVRDSIQQVVGQQGVQIAGTMTDSAREFSASADGKAESLVRRLLRLRPRRELPPSPLAGKPLTMYLSWNEPGEGEQGG